MQRANLPHYEKQRVEALNSLNLLQTDPDARFDKLVADLAARLDVPLAAISLLGETQLWHKASFGFPRTSFQNIDRPNTFGAHAILNVHEPLVVSDARADPRFHDNPQVIGPPFVQFYAGKALCEEEGLPIGVMSVIDHGPRSMTADHLAVLSDFAAHAETLIRLHAARNRVARVAATDPLTRLGNRAWFADAIERMAQAEPCCLVKIDIDGFAAVNEQHGTEAGDAVLVQVADRLTALLGAGAAVARLGCDEFGVCVPLSAIPDSSQQLARRLVEAATATTRVNGQAVTLNASVGMAHFPAEADTAAGLSRHADQALRMAKRSARAGFSRIADDGNDPTGMPTRSLEHDLLKAIKKRTFELHWQPIVEIGVKPVGGAFPVCGFEGLLRWERPGHGQVSPAKFIPLAECSGYMTDIDLWVLREACRQAATWAEATPASVNMSAEWICREDLVEVTFAALAAAGLTPERLQIEINEGPLIKNARQVLKNIESLRAMNVRVALDDFGHGQSALSYLMDFPFDLVKLDGHFTRRLRESPNAAAVTRAAIRLGRELGMTVCAEGVEELWHLEFLVDQGCHQAQGYLFGRPSLKAHRPGPASAASAPGVHNREAPKLNVA